MNRSRQLATLLQLREHRVEVAQREVLARRRELEAAIQVTSDAERKAREVEHERDRRRAEQIAPPPAGLDWGMVLAQREAHIEWLCAELDAALAVVAEKRNEEQQARARLEAQRAEWTRMSARRDALKSQHGEERRREAREQARREELEQPEFPAMPGVHGRGTA